MGQPSLMKLESSYIATLRAANQQLTNRKFKTAKEIAGWMGAIQAQDYSMSKWAFGIRLKNSTEASINNEINSGRIIRTHLLRPTWHFVSADDIYWILGLTAPRIRAALKTRDSRLELTEAVYSKSNRIFERSLRDGNHLTREELISELKEAKIDVQENRASHIFMRAELDGLICSGRQKAGKPTFALLGEWVPEQKRTSRQEALKELARRYFTSHGPATIQDFNWWSGLTMSDAKKALEFNKEILISFEFKDQTYWMANTNSEFRSKQGEIFFLPAYDEFLISYRDRSASLTMVDNKKTISDNGVFYPVILQNGQVTGTWKRTIMKKRVTLTRNTFISATPDQENLYLKGIKRYSDFLGRDTELKKQQT
jgi:hypothetical protein